MEINCTPTQFESALEALCQRMGFSVQLTQASHDGGVDLHVIDPTPIRGGRYIVQAKRYRGGVGEPIMRDLYGTLLHSGAIKAILITTGYFTEGAIAFVQGKPIELVDGVTLERLIEQYQLHDEFSGDASLAYSDGRVSSATADELLAEYADEPSDVLFASVLRQLREEERHEEIAEFGAAHFEQLLSSASHCSTYFRSLVLADRLERLPIALARLWKAHFNYLPQVLVHSVFLLVDKEATARRFAEAIQTVVESPRVDLARCMTLAKAFLLLGDRPRSFTWLTTAMQSRPDDAECLCLLAAYEIVGGQHAEALTHLSRSILVEPTSIAAVHNYQAATLGFKNAFVEFRNPSEGWFLLCMLSGSEVDCLDEVPELKKEAHHAILENVLKGDPRNLNIREALLALLPWEQQIELGEELAYEVEEQTNGVRPQTKVAGILQYAYLQQARANPNDKERATTRGIEWTKFLLKTGIRDVDTLYVGASLMFDPNDKPRAAAFLKDHLHVVLTNVELTRFYCACLKSEDAIAILEQVLTDKLSRLSRKELHVIRYALAYHYQKSGNSDKAIPLYNLETDFQDKEEVSTYLFLLREMKGTSGFRVGGD